MPRMADPGHQDALPPISMRYVTSQRYEIRFSEDVLNPYGRALADLVGDRRGLVITTPSVARQYGDSFASYATHHQLDIRVAVLELGESRKTLGTIAEVAELAQGMGLGRRDVLVGFGGGVCCDIVSYAASSIRRGIPHVFIPTTLIGQVDAAIGLKGGVNFNGRKNYLGCFEAPDGVLVDPSFLATLSVRDLRSGIAEMLKMALLRDSRLFAVLEASGSMLIDSAFTEPRAASRTSIHGAVASMLAELEPNPYEDRTDKRRVDFGHTFSGAMEERSQYDLKHGEAVAIDMMISSLLANELGLLADTELERIIDLYRRLALPMSSECSTPEILDEGLAGSIAHRGGNLNLVIPTGIGSSTFVVRRSDVPESALAAALERSLALDDEVTPFLMAKPLSVARRRRPPS